MSSVLGMGNALVDVMTRLKDESVLKEFKLPKGSMQLVSQEFSNSLLAGTLGLERKQSSGGSAANTINGLANLGVPAGFVGKIGRDNLGEFFERDLRENGIRPVLFHSLEETGRAIALISQDAERTFATYLGAAVDLHEEDISSDIFNGYDYFHVEGYLVQNQDLMLKALRLAKKKNLTVSIDMASFNVVKDNKVFLDKIISEYIDIVLANESEAEAFTGKKPEEAVKEIAGITDIAVVKLGRKGSLVKRGSEEHRIGVIDVVSIDSTGAGDMYAAGFLYGLCHQQDLDICGRAGALLGGNIMEVVGAKMDSSRWEDVRTKMKEICCD